MMQQHNHHHHRQLQLQRSNCVTLNQITETIKDAILNENVELLKKILSQYNNLLYQPIDANGLSLLHYAVQKGKKRIVDELSSMMFENNGTNVKDNVSQCYMLFVM